MNNKASRIPWRVSYNLHRKGNSSKNTEIKLKILKRLTRRLKEHFMYIGLGYSEIQIIPIQSQVYSLRTNPSA